MIARLRRAHGALALLAARALGAAAAPSAGAGVGAPLLALPLSLSRGRGPGAARRLLGQPHVEHGGLGEAGHAQQARRRVGGARRGAAHARRAVEDEGGLDGERAELGVVAVEAEGGARGGADEGPAARARLGGVARACTGR